MKKILLLISLIAVIASMLYFTLTLKPPSLEVEVVSCSISIDKWRVERLFKLTLVNKGDSNITISEVKVNGATVKWASETPIITPGAKLRLYIYYPWAPLKKYSIEVITERGSVKTEVKAPELKERRLKLVNTGEVSFKGIVSVEVFFSDKECLPGCIKVVDEEGEETISQMWGYILYDSGYVKTAVVSFIANIPPKSSKVYKILLTSKPPEYEVEGILAVEESKNYIKVSNGLLTVGFNLSFAGSIDFFGDPSAGVNFAKIFKPPGTTLSELYFFHGFIDSVLDSNGKMYAIAMKTKVTVESKGPLLVVVKRKWNLRLSGQAFDFYALPVNESYLLYRFVIVLKEELGLGALAGTGEYTIYNPAGMGSFAISHVAVKKAEFFLTPSGETYAPLYPGLDIPAEKPVAACIDHETGVYVALLSNDPVHPVGYWHLSRQKFPWHIWKGDKPSPSTSEIGGYEYAKDLSFIAGVHKYMLCYVEQRSDPWRRGGIVIRPGTYSWMTAVGAVVKKDVVSELKSAENYFTKIVIEPAP